MRIGFLVWLVVVVCVSLSPFEVKSHIHSTGRYHNFYHLIAFLGSMILLGWNARSLTGRLSAALAVVGIAFGTEFLERVQFRNPFEWRDIGSDCTGVLLGYLVVTAVHVLSRSRQPQRSPELEARR